MSTKNKKNLASEALAEMDGIKAAIKEESKDIMATLLKEAVKDYMRDSVEDEDDFEVQSDEDEKDTADNSVEGGNSESGAEFPELGDSDEVSADYESSDDEGEAEDGADAEVPAESDAEGDEGGESDAWSEFDDLKVGDDTYDLTGVKDYDKVVKVYKLLKDEDNVTVVKDGDKVQIKDADNDAEYIIDLGADDDEPVSEEPNDAEDALNEADGSNIAGLPTQNENKKTRKTMKEHKEKIFEVDLGYTDNYQKEDPLDSNLSMSEPGKGKDWDKGLPKGTEKPWVGDKVKSSGKPYGEGESVNEEEKEVKDIVDGDQQECNMEEATNVGGDVQERSSSKSNIPSGREEYVPDGTRHYSKAGDYKEVKLAESILAKSQAVLKENKELKEALSKVKSALQEALMVNVNLGRVTKLFLENSTTQEEKRTIINRFNEVKTIDQSNALYESIKRELVNTKQAPILENKSMTASGSEINENKIYESKDLLDIKNFMQRMDNC